MENKKDKLPKNEYEMIQEKIVPKKKKRVRMIVHFLGKTIVFAVLFGMIAGGVFAVTERFFVKHWGMDDLLHQLLTSNKQNQQKTEENKTGNQPTALLTPDLSDNSQNRNPQITVSVGEGTNPGAEGAEKTNGLPIIQEYYEGIAMLAKQAGKSLIRISAITEGVDWFEETYETKKAATGLFVSSTEQELFFLVNLDSIEGATKLEVMIGNGDVLPASLYSYDTNYRLAIISVAKSVIAGATEEFLPKAAEFMLDGAVSGTPVVILGTPNQHINAIEVGMITGAAEPVKLTDDTILYFTTNVTEYAGGDGFVFDMEGRVLGILSASLNNGETGIFCAASIGRIYGEVERLLNKRSRVFCGIYAETVSDSVKDKYHVPGGIYISEVQTSSPALSAGLKVGDIIVKVNGSTVESVEGFHHILNSVSTGRSCWFTVSRDTAGERKEQDIPVMLEYRAH